MTEDLNKGIEVEYNHLNLPKRVVFNDNSSIEYIYAADGTEPKTFNFDINFPDIRNTYKNKDLPFNLKIMVSTKYNLLNSKEIVMRN